MIAGAVIGAIVGLIAIIGVIVALLRKKKQDSEGEKDVQREQVHEAEDSDRNVHEAGTYSQAPQMEGNTVHQLKSACVAAELDAPAQARAAELPAGNGRRG